MITSSDITAAFPALSVVAAGTWTWAIGEAYDELDVTAWGDQLDRAALFLAAHYAAMVTPGLAIGMVTEEHVGPVGHTMGFPTGYAADDYSLTRYGIMYRRFAQKTVDYWAVA